MSAHWIVSMSESTENSGLTKLSVTGVDGDVEQTYSIDVHRADNKSYEFFCDAPRWKMLNSELKYRKGDIIVGSYAKCGTTWLEQIVLLLLNDGKKEAMDPSAKNNYVKGANVVQKFWPEAALLQDPTMQNHIGKQATPISLQEFADMPDPRVMKSHGTVDTFLGANGEGLAGLPEGVKVVLITRNPFDACVSSYYYGHNAHRQGWPFEAWAAMFLSGMLPQGDWFEWVRGWHAQVAAPPERALWLHYEDIHSDAAGQVRRIAAYLGVLRDSAEEMDALIARVVEHSTFGSMVAQAAARQPSDGFFDPHLRQGRSGGWCAYFDVNSDIYKAFVDKFHATLDGTGLHYSLGEGSGVLTAASDS